MTIKNPSHLRPWRLPDGTYKFAGAHLNGLEDCDLRGSDFTDAFIHPGGSLSSADLRGCTGLPEAPAIENLDGKILAKLEAGEGRLAMGFYHWCETVHCRAGWAVVMAGAPGASLERRYGSSIAGALIYAASYPDEPVPDFYGNKDTALEDMRRRRDLATS